MLATPPQSIAPTGRAATSRGRWVAGPASIGVIAHIWVLFDQDHGVAMTVVLAVMTLVCAGCAVEVAVVPSRRGLRVILGMSWVMIALHLGMLLGLGSGGSGHAHHGAPVTVPGGAVAPVDLAMLAIIAVEFLVATCCAIALRQRSPIGRTGARLAGGTEPPGHDAAHDHRGLTRHDARPPASAPRTH